MGGPPLHSTYDYPLVALSVLIAIAASYAALTLAERVSMARNQARTAWLFGGAVAMGTGIWSMHYTGMIAYRLPVQVYCHVPTVLLSLLAAIGASFVALLAVSRPKMNAVHVVAGSLLMAAGISAMHYIGMAAMRLSAMHHYDNDVVIGSVVIAWVVSLAALGLSKMLKGVASVTMGIAIPIMHYTAMAAVSYQSMPGSPDLSSSMEISALGYIAIVVITLVVLVSICLLRWWPTLVELPPQLHAKDGVADKSPT